MSSVGGLIRAGVAAAAAARRRSAAASGGDLLSFGDVALDRDSEGAAAGAPGWAFYDLSTPWPAVDAARVNPAVGDTGGILIEAARANTLHESADPSAAVWLEGGDGVKDSTDAAVAAPDGGVALTLSFTNSDSWIYQAIAYADNVTITMSVYVRCDSTTGSELVMSVRQKDGSTVVSSPAIPLNETPDWTRYTFTTSVGAGAFDPQIRFGVNANYEGDGFDVWGFQSEVGLHESSPIRTGAGSATRLGDLAQWTMPAEMYTVGFEIDYHPSFRSDLSAYNMAMFGLAGSASRYVRIAAESGSAKVQWRNGGSIIPSTNLLINFAPGDKVTFRVEFGAFVSVFVNDVFAGSIDISAEGDWSAVSGSLWAPGALATTVQAFGFFSLPRALPEPFDPLGAELYLWPSIARSLALGSANILSLPNLGTAGPVLDMLANTGVVTFDTDHAVFTGTTRLRTAGVASALSVPDGEMLDVLVIASTTASLTQTVIGGTGGAHWRLVPRSDGGASQFRLTDGGTELIELASTFPNDGSVVAIRGRFTGAASPANDGAFIRLNDADSAPASADLGDVTVATTFDLGAVTGSGFNGKVFAVVAKVGGFSAPELAELTTRAAEFGTWTSV